MPHGGRDLGRLGKGGQGEEDLCLEAVRHRAADEPKERGDREPHLILVHHRPSTLVLRGRGENKGRADKLWQDNLRTSIILIARNNTEHNHVTQLSALSQAFQGRTHRCSSQDS